MGQCLETCRYASERTRNPLCWQDWTHHRARQFYHIGCTLGKGAFSEVRARRRYVTRSAKPPTRPGSGVSALSPSQVVSARRRDTGKPVALKVVFLGNPKLHKEHVSVLRNEVEVMMRLDHRNIPHVFCVIEDPVRRQLVMEVKG